MKRIHTLRAIGCGLLFAASTCFAQMYTLMDLVTTPDPMCPSGSYLSAGVNASGQSAGSCLTGHFPTHAFRTAPNSPINPATDDLGTFGGDHSVARGINDLGQVVGISQDTEAVYHAFRTIPNGFTNSADDVGNVDAQGINNLGQVVGRFYGADSGSFSHAFRTAPNRPFNPATDDLGTPLGGRAYRCRRRQRLGPSGRLLRECIRLSRLPHGSEQAHQPCHRRSRHTWRQGYLCIRREQFRPSGGHFPPGERRRRSSCLPHGSE